MTSFSLRSSCCFRLGNHTDALILSSCGGLELWAKTQGQYFAKEAEKRPYLSIVNAVIHNQLDEIVQRSEPRKWRETLAVLSTYAKAEEFPSLCQMLGYMLEESGEPQKHPNLAAAFRAANLSDRWRGGDLGGSCLPGSLFTMIGMLCSSASAAIRATSNDATSSDGGV